ncbi:hypothetical protein DAI22_06g147900 [Oryza sativa Japonica Group]|nr:hypothetical protein DAI22_06g147900 [Oryza sativa Japonica Group]
MTILGFSSLYSFYTKSLVIIPERWLFQCGGWCFCRSRDDAFIDVTMISI